MTGRIALGGLLGGIVLFFWGFLSHMVLALGDAGLRPLPEEARIALGRSLTEPGLYFYPGFEHRPGMSPEEQARAEKEWTEKAKTGPYGILSFVPLGGEMPSPRQLLAELGSNLLSCLVAAWLLWQAPPPGYWRKVLFVAALGLLVFLTVDVSYWNWYRFPAPYALAQLVDHTVGYFLAGLVLAKVVKRAL